MAGTTMVPEKPLINRKFLFMSDSHVKRIPRIPVQPLAEIADPAGGSTSSQATPTTPGVSTTETRILAAIGALRTEDGEPLHTCMVAIGELTKEVKVELGTAM
jgi:hypothetical protein